jgi:arylsulfatase A-like enzyme
MGRVVEHLDALGIREDTIIVYTTDHGEFAGEHGMIEKSPGIGFRCVTQVPLIYSWKGHLDEGEARNALVESIDFLPTVCALAGLEMPNWVDGMNIEKVLESDEDIRDIAVTENPYTKTLHTKKYKYTQYIPDMQNGEDFGELYDIENDPWELRNLYFEPAHQDTVNDLRYKLYCWLVRTTRNITVNTNAPSKDWSCGWERRWELADELYGDDGKLGFDIAQELIRKGWANYL